MKKYYLIICLAFYSLGIYAQSAADSARQFNWPQAFTFKDSVNIKLHPNPARDNVFVSVKDWDINARYTFLLNDNKGRPVKNLILLQPQQLISLRSNYGKGLLWVEVWKEKILLGREKLYIR
jgi:uncharacterized membrane protein